MRNDNGGNSTNPLDMTLEELINANKTTSSQQTGRGGRRYQRSSVGPRHRPSYRRGTQKHFNYGVVDGQRSGWAESGTVKIYISNLSYKVDDKDIEELFSDRGRLILKKSAVHYNAEGHSMGTAEVVFADKKDAESAIQKYQNRRLDGKPLRIEMVDEETRRGFTRGGRGRVRVRGRRGRGSGGRGRGRGGRGRRQVEEDEDNSNNDNNEEIDMDMEL